MDAKESLKRAILRHHGCESEHIESVPVKEIFRDKVVWEGVVEVFKLIGHPIAKKCYAWSRKEGKNDSETRYITILELPPVNSPQTAVQTYIASYIRKNHEKQ